LYGIETEFYARELASIVVWIGFLQWKHERRVEEDREPVLQKLDTIEHGDAILRYDDKGNPNEPEWPKADFIIGNPPFVGGNRIRAELGDQYVNDLFKVYKQRVRPAADLVCYWFEKARACIVHNPKTRAGLLATQGIRGGANRQVLHRIKETGGIFFAESDRTWSLDGAMVHISMLGFDSGTQTRRELNGRSVIEINANLTTGEDATRASALEENRRICFMGPSPKAPFDIDSSIARKMLSAPLNVNGRPNADVVKRVQSGVDLTQRDRSVWTIDFGMMPIEEAAQYELPFEYVKHHIFPLRTKGRKALYGERWWQYGRPRVEMRIALKGLTRYIATPATAKHRIFVWVPAEVLCNQGTLVYARSEDFFMGMLHSSVHEVWARAQGTQLRDADSGFRYTPTSCFESFPFPWPANQPVTETDDTRIHAIAQAARNLIRLRDNWLNPTGIHQSEIKQRTLTNLYNNRPVWLENAHADLDRAVFQVYGWRYPLDRSQILQHLLELNLGVANSKAPALDARWRGPSRAETGESPIDVTKKKDAKADTIADIRNRTEKERILK
jgi:type II restriction/modification system DNA methylase subunit YeeA